MATAAGDADSIDFGFHPMAHVLCASCGRPFDTPRSRPGDHIPCATCGAVVTVGARVGIRRRPVAARAFVEPGVDEGRGRTSDAIFILAICAALVGGAFFALRAFCCGGDPPKGRAADDSSATDPIVTTDSGEW